MVKKHTMPEPLAPFSSPLYVMAKPAGAACNLACRYCYYLEKDKIYAGSKATHIMSDEVLRQFIKSYIDAQTTPEVLFCWHGGEALLRPLSFYRRAMELQRYYGKGRHILNTIQTNGTLLNEEWCSFFHENGWLVGISIDGPAAIHDRYRLTPSGEPTFQKVLSGIGMLQRYGVEWNALAAVNAEVARHPVEFYEFFRSIDCRFVQFTPVVERLMPHADGRSLASAADAGAPLAEFSVNPADWGAFLCEIFDRWVRNDVGRVFVQLFDATLANWMGVPPSVCSMAAECGHAAVMEHNGDVYSCDHFVFPEFRLGNIRRRSFVEMLTSEKQLAFGRAKRDSLPGQCRKCRWLFACHGECPRNRFAITSDGETGLNYLCEGYRRFFDHVAPYMDFMKAELLAGRSPANVMKFQIMIKK